MEVAAKEGGLKGFEKAKDIYIHSEPFSVENGLLTPTMKLKRYQAKQVNVVFLFLFCIARVREVADL